jgi:Receptor family ligand binding region
MLELTDWLKESNKRQTIFRWFSQVFSNFLCLTLMTWGKWANKIIKRASDSVGWEYLFATHREIARTNIICIKIPTSFSYPICSGSRSPGLAADMKFKQNVIAFIGPACAFALEPVARLAAYWNTPIITGMGDQVSWNQFCLVSDCSRASGKFAIMMMTMAVWESRRSS